MSSKYSGRLILRTPLITAGHKEKYIEKALHSEADAVILDLEDGAPAAFKEQARKTIRNYLDKPICSKRLIYVRLNSLETGLTGRDVDAVSHANLDGFVMTKVYTAEEVISFDKMLTAKEKELGLKNNHFTVIVIMETPRSILNAREIAFSTPRVGGLLYGAEDLLSDMEGLHTPDGRSMQPSRSQVLLAARAAGIMPIDTPYVQVGNDEGLRNFIQPGLELGYEGMLLISPSQIPIARELFTPSAAKVEDAYEMLKIAAENEQAQQGVARVGKYLITQPNLKRAQRLIARYEALKTFDKFAAGYLKQNN
ncbi:MAG: CoA ester lyase [Candidatus Cloacimonetes bacterium]|nr:CoA ester lyase [Candidatus Cloacimonadota bacterium]